MIFKNKPILILFISLAISLIACSGDNNDITNESQVDLPDDFNHTAYWENNEKVQESCGKSDSLCIEEHWFDIGQPAGLSYLPVIEISSSEVSSSSEEISSSTESSSSEVISSSAEISSSSELSSSSSVVIQTVAAPTFSIAAGTYTTAQNVTLSSTTAGADIYYTQDGSTPSTSSTLYSSAISVSATQTIKAIAVKTGWNNSAVTSAEYVIYTPINTRTCTYNSTNKTLACNEKTYKTATIGIQVWMAENLAYLPQVDAVADGSEDTGFEDDSFYYVYDYTPSGADEDAEIANAKLTTNYQTYGVLYNWNAAMDGATSSSASPSGVQGICPTGWHLPSDDEWETLADYVANDAGLTGKSLDDWTQIGVKLKATSGWNSSGNGTDDFGFSGLPGGYRNSNGSYYVVGYYGFWWSSTELSSSNAYYRNFYYDFDYFFRSDDDKADAYSVRCIQDTP